MEKILTIVIITILFNLIFILFERNKLLKTIKRLRDERNFYQYHSNYERIENVDKSGTFYAESIDRKSINDNLNIVESSELNELQKINNFLNIVKIQDKFYSFPNAEGVFELTDEKPESSSVYKFIFNFPSQQKANYVLCNTKSNLNAYLLAKDVFISYGCNMTNEPSADTKEIKITSPGIVSFNGKNWKIEKKCEIRFV